MSGFCPKCGKAVEDGQVFCSGCGNKVGNPENTAGYVPPQPTMQPPQPQMVQPQAAYAQPPYYPAPRKKGTLLIILSIVFFLLAGAAVAFIFLFGPYDAKPMDLNGNWDSVLTPEKIINADTEYISKSDLGDGKDAQMQLVLDKTGEGTMIISGMTFDVAYKSGKITGKTMLDAKLQVSIDGTLKKEKDEYTFTGTWKYTIIKGADKGEIAEGSWTAVLVEPDAKASALDTPNSTKTPGTSGITAADFEGTWKGEIVMVDIPGLDANPNIPEEDKAIMRTEIGTKSEMVFIFKNGKFWVGDESESQQITDADMGTYTASGNSFTGDVTTPIGKANVTGDVTNVGGKSIITATLMISDVPAANSDTEKVTVKATFTGEKQ